MSPRRVQGLARGPADTSGWELGVTRRIDHQMYFRLELARGRCVRYHTFAAAANRRNALTTTSGSAVSQYGGSEARRYPP